MARGKQFRRAAKKKETPKLSEVPVRREIAELPGPLRTFAELSRISLHPHELILLGQAWDIQSLKNGRTFYQWYYHGKVKASVKAKQIYRLWPTRPLSVAQGTGLYHGTSARNAAGILVRGFKIPDHDGMFGRGIYWTDSFDKALNYVGYDDTFIIVHARVALGNVLVAEKAMTHLRYAPSGYDSVHGKAKQTASGWTAGGTLQHNEWCIYDKARIAIQHVDIWKRVDTP